MNREKELLSFRDVAEQARRSEKTVLLLRHSMRESLKNGTSDPALTPEGMEYARSCGALLSLPGDAGSGASPRKRTVQTAKLLSREMTGGESRSEVRIFPEISDTAMFKNPEKLDMALRDWDIPALLRQYYSTGTAAGMKDLEPFSAGLVRFLTETDFGCRNMVLVTHDILIVALLTALRVRVFTPDDRCGHIEGAALFRSSDGRWTIAYAVPDVRTRKKMTLFI